MVVPNIHLEATMCSPGLRRVIIVAKMADIPLAVAWHFSAPSKAANLF